jgi:hypothetical protein
MSIETVPLPSLTVYRAVGKGNCHAIYVDTGGVACLVHR